MLKAQLRHMLVALLLLVSMQIQGTWALAGTTGGLSGTVYKPGGTNALADAQVTVSSPSQTSSVQTDANGRFSFVSLAPDTYIVSVTKIGFEPTSLTGVSVFADQTQTVSITSQPKLKEIGNVSSRAVGDIVKSGTTADVYSVNAATQDKVSAVGGGGSLNSAYSAIATVPGAFVPLNQTGYFQTVHIRGGDYDQVGYELDGVPVNRAFDNYPSGAASSLGQQELQVYTGATPASSEGQGLAGYINQVIRTGTYPGFGNLAVGAGTPAFYHKLSAEAGGATPNRNFSYYIGLGGYGQDFRYVTQQNAANYSTLSPPAYQQTDPAGCTSTITAYSSCYANGAAGPGGFALFPYQYGFLSTIADRDAIANIHIAIPHKRDAGKDDIQILYDSGYLNNAYYSSPLDEGGLAFLKGGPAEILAPGTPAYSDSFSYTGPVGTALPAGYSAFVQPYYFPSSPQNRAYGSAIPLNARDIVQNSQEVLKVQYQKNLSSNAYIRVYGYTYYSDWLQNGPNGANLAYIGTGASPDYELNSHTRGLSLSFSDQLNDKHLLSLQGNYTTSSTLRDNNTQMFNGVGTRSLFAVLSDPNSINNPANPNYGVCYTYNGPGLAATPTSCNVAAHPATFLQYPCAQTNSCTQDIGGVQVPIDPTSIAAGGATCGSGPCTYYVAENGKYATYNTVKPTFSALSITDQWRPTDKLLFNIGLRSDTFKYEGSNTKTDAARDFWFAAFNLDNCINTVTGAPTDKVTGLGLASPTSACPAGYTTANLQNVPSQVNSYTIVQPRLGATYTINSDTVLRASAGKYVEPPNSAYEQYNTLQENLPGLLGGTFYKFGFTTPGHAIVPPVSYNYDFSYERHFKGTDWSMKLTPFLRKTQNQIQQFFLDQATGFVSGLNVGRQTSEGVELQVNKGNFTRNGLSGSLAFTYTNSFIRYNALSNGTSVVSGINNDIQNYNAFTKVCQNDAAAHGGTALNSNCGKGSAASAPCYTTGGVPDPACASTSIGNPYWNAPVSGTLDPGANYPVYDLFPGPIGSSAQAFQVPYSATLVLNYKRDKFAITPSFQFAGGGRYGAPETSPGIDPTVPCAVLGPAGAADPRYPYGNPGPNAYDATSCGGSLAAIPNPYTGKFDGLGAFRQPSQFIMNLQTSYQLTPKVELVGTFANLVNKCFGGDVKPWTSGDQNVCSYGILNNAGNFPPVGNFYNPGTPIQQLVKYPYAGYLGSVNVDGNSTKTPFNFFIEVRIKI